MLFYWVNFINPFCTNVSIYFKAFQYFVAFTIEIIGKNPEGNYMFKVNTRARCEMCSKLTIKTPEPRHCLYC